MEFKLYKEVNSMKIQIAGLGCPRCQMTEKNVFNACAELDLDADISHLYDIMEMTKLGVMSTPAVIVDGKNILSGKVPTVNELKKIFTVYK
jgi:small redox-active disulfide protein 2